MANNKLLLQKFAEYANQMDKDEIINLLSTPHFFDSKIVAWTITTFINEELKKGNELKTVLKGCADLFCMPLGTVKYYWYTLKK